jgi:alpha-glucosidase
VDPDGRDPARTPMQWDTTPGAGFSTGPPWLPIPATARTVNAAAQRDDPGSLLNLYRDLIQLRRGHPALLDGGYTPLLLTEPAVYAYLRVAGKHQILVALNFDDQPHALDHPAGGAGQILFSTHRTAGSRARHPLQLAAHEGVIANLS